MLVTYNPGVIGAGREPRRVRGHDLPGARSTAAPLPFVASRLLELQRTAGNRAVTLALQRSSAGGPGVQRLDLGLDGWSMAERAVRASATSHELSALFVPDLQKYAEANPADGAILLNALAQSPKHFKGGALLAAQQGAEAITFGNSIFYRDDPRLSTFIHEMVHINQYALLGREAFVLSYFGMSLATIIKRAIAGEPIEPMKSSPHETQAYDLAKRFRKWRFGE